MKNVLFSIQSTIQIYIKIKAGAKTEQIALWPHADFRLQRKQNMKNL